MMIDMDVHHEEDEEEEEVEEDVEEEKVKFHELLKKIKVLFWMNWTIKEKEGITDHVMKFDDT